MHLLTIFLKFIFFTDIYIIFEKGGISFNHNETYNKFKAKFLPENRHKTSNEIAQRKLGQSINNILIKIFQKTNKKRKKFAKLS